MSFSYWLSCPLRCAVGLAVLYASDLGCAFVHAQLPPDAPTFEKVDPPSWWTKSTLPTVRLLIRGKNLKDATVTVNSPKIVLSNFKSSDNGHYLFADVTIDETCPAGAYQLTLATKEFRGQTFPFTVTEKLAEDKQPQGYTTDDAIYFVMPDRFADGEPSNNKSTKSPDLFDRSKPRHYHGGDLQGLIQRLPYIQSLGMTAIWTTPIYDNNDGLDFKEAYPNANNVKEPSTSYHGYGAIDMYGIDEHLGDMKKLKEFIDKAHALGMKVIQDQVANHTGPYHVWAKDPPTTTWWNGSVEKHTSNNWQKWTAMNPRATRQTQALNIDGWFIDVLPDFNQDDPEVATYLIQNSIWWMHEVGFDAIRMDTLPHVPRSFWSRWAQAIKAEYPKTTILGELFDSDPALLAYYQAGRVGHDHIDTHIDTLFDFGLFGPIRNAFARGRNIRDISQTFAHDWLYPNANVLTTFAGVHDMQRFMSEDGATVDGLNLAFTLIMTSRGTPLVYYGDEIAMKGGADPDNRRDFPGGFPGDARSAFDPAGRNETEAKVWNHLAKLGQIRKEHVALRQGKSLDLVDQEQQFVYARVTEAESIIVVMNNDKKPSSLKFDVSMLPVSSDVIGAADVTDLLANGPNLAIRDGQASLIVPARSATLYVLKGK
jgi:neopullulanase